MTTTESRPQPRCPEIIAAVADALLEYDTICPDAESRDTVREALVKVLGDSWDWDGFELGEKLHHWHGWYDMDAATVEDLDRAGHLGFKAHQRLVAEWVQRNNVQLRHKVGDKVPLSVDGERYLGDVVGLDVEYAQYTVRVPELGHDGVTRLGFVLDCEQVDEV